MRVWPHPFCPLGKGHAQAVTIPAWNGSAAVIRPRAVGSGYILNECFALLYDVGFIRGTTLAAEKAAYAEQLEEERLRFSLRLEALQKKLRGVLHESAAPKLRDRQLQGTP